MVELCTECGFDARELAGNQDEQLRLDTAYADLERLRHHPDLDRRPAPETWSAREYVEHCLEVAAVILGWVADLTGTRAPLGFADLAACRRAVALVVRTAGGTAVKRNPPAGPSASGAFSTRVSRC